jgi:hypothetical protein
MTGTETGTEIETEMITGRKTGMKIEVDAIAVLMTMSMIEVGEGVARVGGEMKMTTTRKMTVEETGGTAEATMIVISEAVWKISSTNRVSVAMDTPRVPALWCRMGGGLLQGCRRRK